VPNGRRELEELRKELGQLDEEILSALDRRARAARRLGELRRDHAAQLPVGDRAAIRDLVARSAGDMPPDALFDIFREIYAACLSLELPVRVAYVGVEGGPGHSTAGDRFGRTSSLVGVETAAAALDEVARRRAEFAVVPFQTSNEGAVQSTIHALLASELRIAEMLDAAFDLHVVVRADVAVVEKVYATPADHALCERFFAHREPKLSVIDVRSPRLACELAVQEPGAAAVASETFAAQFGLVVSIRSILDRTGDRVRYAVAGARPSGRTGQDVTSLVFTVGDAAGSLLDVLRVLAERGINLTNVESHPMRGEAWSYLFYVELAGHFTDRPLVTAFEDIKRRTRSFKVLGSYPSP
jgi:chorismate mutase/prephenate dehydratase